MNLTTCNLENCFNQAKVSNAKYVGIIVAMAGFAAHEVIINSVENFDAKLKYYQNTYDENLKHKYAPGISIVGFSYGDSFKDIESDLFG